MINCVTISNSHNFDQNLVKAQHELRYKEVISKEQWKNIYTMDGMEFDRYDNLATEYFVARNETGQVVGVTRSYPTTLPYMLQESFFNLFSKALPSTPKVFEASRLVLDRELLTKEERIPVINRLIVAYMERGLQKNIDGYVGFMLPKIWKSTFIRAGWDVMWLGSEETLGCSGDKVRAAFMPVSEEMNEKIRKTTGIREKVLDFGTNQSPTTNKVATWSDEEIQQPVRKAA